jgi:hypothetical protein
LKYLETSEYDTKLDYLQGRKANIKLVTFTSDEVIKLAACEPTAMLDMPLKILIWEEQGDTFIACTNAINYKRRYKITSCVEVLSDINKSLIRIINDAIRIH